MSEVPVDGPKAISLMPLSLAAYLIARSNSSDAEATGSVAKPDQSKTGLADN